MLFQFQLFCCKHFVFRLSFRCAKNGFSFLTTFAMPSSHIACRIGRCRFSFLLPMSFGMLIAWMIFNHHRNYIRSCRFLHRRICISVDGSDLMQLASLFSLRCAVRLSLSWLLLLLLCMCVHLASSFQLASIAYTSRKCRRIYGWKINDSTENKNKKHN